MRIRGASDIVYRAYDLLAHKDNQDLYSVLMWLGFLRRPILQGDDKMVLMALQQEVVVKYNTVLTLKQIEDMIYEFFVWWRLSTSTKRKWPYRDPDQARKLYEDNLKATGMWYKR